MSKHDGATVDGEHFRGRIYVGQEMTLDRAMHYAVSSSGLPAYTAPERITRVLTESGWVERRERTATIPADTNRHSMFYGEPERTACVVTYHATERGLREWSRG